MKHMGSMLTREGPFEEIVMGNTALVRAMIESGTRVVTSYPGSPTPEIATAIRSIPKEKRPFYFEFSTNEKVATEVAFGAAMQKKKWPLGSSPPPHRMTHPVLIRPMALIFHSQKKHWLENGWPWVNCLRSKRLLPRMAVPWSTTTLSGNPWMFV